MQHRCRCPAQKRRCGDQPFPFAPGADVLVDEQRCGSRHRQRTIQFTYYKIMAQALAPVFTCSDFRDEIVFVNRDKGLRCINSGFAGASDPGA